MACISWSAEEQSTGLSLAQSDGLSARAHAQRHATGLELTRTLRQTFALLATTSYITAITTTPLIMADTQEEPLFDPSLKKKKGSKKTVDFSGLDDEAAAAPAPVEAGSSNDAAPEAASAVEGEDDMFGGLKKKKKSKKAIPMDLELVSCAVDWR